MMKINYYLIFIFILSSLAQSATVLELEKMRFENETTKSKLYIEIEEAKKKILENQLAVQEKKAELVRFSRADRQLSKFQFGGLMAIESRALLERNLFIFNRLKQQNLNSLRELKYYAEDLDRHKKSLIQKNDDLDHLNNQILDQEKALITAEVDSIKKLVAEKKDSLLLFKGKLVSPLLNSRIKFNFGASYSDDQNQYSQLRKGITYQGEINQIVQAVGPGKIIFRDHIKYWGESVIIEHAGDYYSVYTNLKNCLVEKNQTVSQSEIICETTAEEFYFELRNQNIAINPKNWIRN